MGGRAFAEKYNTPRLTPASYASLCQHATKTLAAFFEGIRIPAHDPAKTSHGDADFIVYSTKDVEATPEEVGEALGAVDMIVGKPTTNYVIPWQGEFAQVDVHRQPKEYHEMQVFLHSYGRLGHILNIMVLRFGLYLDHVGLYSHKPTFASPAFLITPHLTTLLDILHLPLEPFLQGFETRETLWTWLESGQIAGIPLVHGWKSSQKPEGDDIWSDWLRRRAGEPLLVDTIDKAAVLQHVLESQGQVQEYEAWKVRLEEEERMRAEEQKRQEAMKTEIKRRLKMSTKRGKEIKEEAQRIRREVEAEYADCTMVELQNG